MLRRRKKIAQPAAGDVDCSCCRATNALRHQEMPVIATTPATETLASSVDTALRLADKTLDGVDQLSTLNLQLVKTLLAESAEKAQAALAATGPDELVNLHTDAWAALPAKAAAYTRQVQSIVAGVADAWRAETQAQAVKFEASLLDTMSDSLKGVPGGEDAMTLAKSAISTARSAYDNASRTVNSPDAWTESVVFRTPGLPPTIPFTSAEGSDVVRSQN